ncbi:MAG: tRNA (guanosine(46)-N7)-methyltransferase TrmB [Kiritimatiellae bacterium]|nr:tRNA (guanosine(46)-N7)-methyltransferase TrmB [Kiritimatiellia bacterium]
MVPRDRIRSEETNPDVSFVCTSDNWLDPLPLSTLFGRDAPLEVDVGCGKGRFLIARAAQFPDHNFLGIERQLVRVRKVDGKLRRAGITNARLLRLEADYSIRYLLPPQSVDTFYIFFPDPWPKRRHQSHRLLQETFIDNLLRALRAGGNIHLRTDHLDYYETALALLSARDDLQQVETFEPSDEERTEFEILFTTKGLPIGCCSFKKLP